MFIIGLGTAVPSPCHAQREGWDAVQKWPQFSQLKPRSKAILKKVLCGDNGIDTRHLALETLAEVFDSTPDDLQARFTTQAPALATGAARRALKNADCPPEEIDAVLISTCTGYLCPGLTSYVSEQLGLRESIFALDLVGQGCGAAMPNLRNAEAILAAGRAKKVLSVCVEVCSAAFFMDDDPGVLISACLFGDGAAASVWRTRPAEGGLRGFEFNTLHWPAERDRLRFETRDGKLRNLLHRSVPEVAARAVTELWNQRGPRPVKKILSHAGGRDVLTAIEAAVPGYPLAESARVLRDGGNMSSPSVLFALAEALRGGRNGADGDYWLVSFGAGFSAHCCRIGMAE
jgi:predicted naringenin-chalcone synthase